MSAAKHLRPRLSLSVLALAWGCVQPPPDVAALGPLRDEDTRVVRLLAEVDRDAERDPAAAARTIRELVLPVARANSAACSGIHPRHPRARAVASDLCGLLEERVTRLGRYADALAARDTAALLRETRAQREMEKDLGRLESRFGAAERVPATRGCSRAP